MIINGGSYRALGWWTKHLENAETNDRIHVFGGYGLNGAEKSVGDALRRMEEMACGTQAKNFFYQANINAEPGETLTYEQAMEAAERLKDNLGLSGHPSVLIEHVKKGRQHFHMLASRIDGDGRVVRDSFTAEIHERTSREIEELFNLRRGRSILERDRETARPDYRPKKWETMRALETGITPAGVAAKVQELHASADNGRSFIDALEYQGFITCQGDKGRYCILDAAGDVHSLNRRVGMKAPAFREFMKDAPVETLRTMAEARALYAERAAHRDQEREKAGRQEKSGTARGVYGVLQDEAAKAAQTFYFDRDQQARQWEAGLHDAAVAFETDRRLSISAANALERAGRDQHRQDDRASYRGKRGAQIEHHETVRQIGQAYADTETGSEFFDELKRRGLTTARVSDADAERARLHRSYGISAQMFKAGDYVVSGKHGQLYKLDVTTIHADERNILARLAQIDASTQTEVGTLRRQQAEQKLERLSEPMPEPFVPLETARSFIRRGADIFSKALDVTGEAMSLGSSAARVMVHFFEAALSGPSNAISGGSEEQKRHANALSAAREKAKAMRQPPADHSRASSRELPSITVAQSQESDALREVLQRLRHRQLTVRSTERDGDRHRKPDRDRDR